MPCNATRAFALDLFAPDVQDARYGAHWCPLWIIIAIRRCRDIPARQHLQDLARARRAAVVQVRGGFVLRGGRVEGAFISFMRRDKSTYDATSACITETCIIERCAYIVIDSIFLCTSAASSP